MIGFTFLLLSVIMMVSGFLITRNNPTASLTAKYILVLLLWTTYLILIVNSGLLLNLKVPYIPLLIVIPALLIIFYSTSRPAFKVAMGHTPLSYSVYVQSFRILVEFMIYGAFLEKVLPESVTFKGLNFDLLVGVSALLVGLLIQKEKIGWKGVLAWNLISVLVLGMTIYTFATFFYFSDGQLSDSNLRFLNFPYILLPGILVPYALFYHLVSIRKCLTERSSAIIA